MLLLQKMGCRGVRRCKMGCRGVRRKVGGAGVSLTRKTRTTTGKLYEIFLVNHVQHTVQQPPHIHIYLYSSGPYVAMGGVTATLLTTGEPAPTAIDDSLTMARETRTNTASTRRWDEVKGDAGAPPLP